MINSQIFIMITKYLRETEVRDAAIDQHLSFCSIDNASDVN